MKLPLLCVFMGLGLVFADQILPEEPPTQMGVQKRGEAYNQCIEGYLSQAIADVSQDEDDTTQRAVEEAANTIRECLAAYTDAPAPERQESMLSCADGAVSSHHWIELGNFDFLTYLCSIRI
jgi:hypothetical protein